MLTYQIDTTRQQLRCTAEGHLNFLQVAELAQLLLEDPEAENTKSTLIVIADNNAAVSLQRLRRLKSLLAQWSIRQRDGRWAIVLPGEPLCATAKLALPSLCLQVADVECFTSVAEAQCWAEAEASIAVNMP